MLRELLTLLAPTPQNGQTHSIRRQKLTNCLSVFDLFVGLALKELKSQIKIKQIKNIYIFVKNSVLDFCESSEYTSAPIDLL